ncbi:hypothetical protein COOONC_07953 [Cooperia oncophora]
MSRSDGRSGNGERIKTLRNLTDEESPYSPSVESYGSSATMPRLKLYIITLLICLRLCTIVLAQNATSEPRKAINELARLSSFRKEVEETNDRMKDLSSRVRTVEDQMSTNKDFSSLLLPYYFRALRQQANNPLTFEWGQITPRSTITTPPATTATTAHQTTTTTASPTDLLRTFANLGWLKAFMEGATQTSQLNFPNMRWLGALGSDVSQLAPSGFPGMGWLGALGAGAPGTLGTSPLSTSGFPGMGWLGALGGAGISPTSPLSTSGFPNMRWLGALGGEVPRYPQVQKHQEVTEYPVIIIPESSFYQLGQPPSRPYPIYPPTGYDQYAVPPATYARPP